MFQRRSVSDSMVVVEGIPVIFQNNIERHVALLALEAKLSSALNSDLDITYVNNMLELVGLIVILTMVLDASGQHGYCASGR